MPSSRALNNAIRCHALSNEHEASVFTFNEEGYTVGPFLLIDLDDWLINLVFLFRYPYTVLISSILLCKE